MSAFRYALGTPKTTTSLPLCASMIILVNRDSKVIIPIGITPLTRNSMASEI